MTIVELDILATLNSKTSKPGDKFPIRLAEPIFLEGKAVIPAGATGIGEVVHAAKARAAGKPGELIIAARYIDFGQTRLPLRSFQYGPGTGKNNVDTAAAVGFVVATPLMLFITGGQVNVPAGTRAHAKLSADVLLPTQPDTNSAIHNEG